MTTIQIELDDDLLARVDECAARQHVSRAAFLHDLLQRATMARQSQSEAEALEEAHWRAYER